MGGFRVEISIAPVQYRGQLPVSALLFQLNNALLSYSILVREPTYVQAVHVDRQVGLHLNLRQRCHRRWRLWCVTASQYSLSLQDAEEPTESCMHGRRSGCSANARPHLAMCYFPPYRCRVAPFTLGLTADKLLAPQVAHGLKLSPAIPRREVERKPLHRQRLAPRQCIFVFEDTGLLDLHTTVSVPRMHMS